jgi:predicted dehydrogenase
MSVDAIVIGAGLRGRFTYGGWACAHPDQLRVVAIAEPDETRRAGMAEEQELPPERVFSDWRELLEQPRMADAAIVATGDTLHVEPALAALERGYHLLLEKPMAPDPADCLRVVRAAERAGRILQVGHVLRHSAFYARVHEIVVSGQLGDIATLDLKEHVAHWHMTHSYVRGKFRNRRIAAPILLAKSCHDLDLLVWLAGARPRRVASFGSLTHFRSESAPQGAPERCTQGCPVQPDCIHDAVRFYLDPHDGIAQIWPWSDVSPNPAREARREALETGPYGRCVYRTDNDALDHQVLAVELDGGIIASFTLQGLATHERRTLRISGSAGELRGVLQTGEIEITRHGTLDAERIQIEGSEIGHFGGDEGLVAHFVDCVSREALDDALTSGRIALESHLLGFAAEQARETGSVVDLDAYCSELEAGIG